MMTVFPTSPLLDRLIDLALEEDLGTGDVTTQALIPPDLRGEAHIRAKQDLVVAGLPLAARVFRKVDANLIFEPQVEEGAQAAPGTVLARLTGPVAAILIGERTGPQFPPAPLRHRHLHPPDGEPDCRHQAALVDTRKTTPGWRALEKYAVRLGGASNHRAGLYDGVLIKNNHLTAAGSITQAVQQARQEAHHLLKIEVEVTDLDGLEEALAAGADVILLDNMDEAAMAQAVKITAGRALLEASGSMSAARLPKVAATGVNLISMGALTHSAPAADIHLRLMKTWR